MTIPFDQMVLAYDAAKLAGFEGTADALRKLMERERLALDCVEKGNAQEQGNLSWRVQRCCVGARSGGSQTT